MEENNLSREQQLEYYRQKIRELENSDEQRSLNIESEKASMRQTQENYYNQINNKTSQVNIGQPQMNVGQPQMTQEQYNYTIQQNYIRQQQYERYQKKQNKEHNSLESFIGKNLMAVAASVLIFVSLIVMCSVIFPLMSDIVKVSILYSVSIALTSFGCIMQRKSKNNWYLTIMACGMTAFYISLFLSNMLFMVINDTILYIGILLWMLAMCFFNKKYSRVFTYIGYAGVIIALSFGCMKYNRDIVATKDMVVMTAFYVTAMIAFNIDVKKESLHNVIIDILNIVSSLVVILYLDLCEYRGFANYFEVSIDYPGLILGCIVILSLVIINITRHIYYEVGTNDYWFPVASLIHNLVAIYAVSSTVGFIHNVDGTSYIGATMYIVLALALLTGTIYKLKDNSAKESIALIPILIALTICVYQTPLAQVTGAFILAIVMIILGFELNKSLYKYSGLAILFISMMLSNEGSTYDLLYFDDKIAISIAIILAIICMTVVISLIARYKEQYSALFKAFTLAVGIVGIVIFQVAQICGEIENLDVEIMLSIQVVLYLLTIASVIYSGLSCNMSTGEKEKPVIWVFRVLCEISIPVVMMLTILMHLSQDNATEIITFYICALALIGYSVLNLGFVQSLHKELGSLYSVFKLSFVVFLLTGLIFKSSLLISVAGAAIASASIAYGFKLKIKSVRIYGLIVALLVTIKLSLLDISLDSTIGKAIALFICGIICFIISFIYNKIDKQEKLNNQVQGVMYYEGNNMHREG